MNTAHGIAKRLHHLTALLSRESDQILQEQLGIGLSQYKILLTVQRRQNSKQIEIAEHLGQTEASISRQIKLLQQKGMIISIKNPNNQREHLTSLTSRGSRVIDAADKILANYHRDFFTGLATKEQQNLGELLDKTLA